jgi:hypothetical protein
VEPEQAPIALEPNGALEFDEHGNPIGGVRSVAIDVPGASNFPNSGSPAAVIFSAKVPFTTQKLRALYGDERGYATRVVARAKDLVAEGWLLPQDADEVIGAAKAFRFVP